MSWTLCTSGAAIAKAGAGADPTIVASGATLATWSNESEASVCMLTRHDWITAFSGLSGDKKQSLADTASDMIAMKIIGYDMSSYPSRLQLQTSLDIIAANIRRNIKALENVKFRETIT